MDTDSALRLLGSYSRWQLGVYSLHAIAFGIPCVWMYLGIVFIGDTPSSYRCALPPNATLNDTIPLVEEDGKWQYSKCEMFRNRSVDNSTIPCTHGYWYDPASGYESTLVTEWDLVCANGWLVELSIAVSSVGSLIGGVVCTRLSDIYGRKPVFLFCLWTNIAVDFIQAFSPNMLFFTVFSFIHGILYMGIYNTVIILAIELFPTEERTFAGNAIELFWAFGYLALAGLAYCIRNWRHLQLALTVPLVCSITFYWLVPESIPWLVANGRRKRADGIMQQAAKFNNISLPDHIFVTEDERQEAASEEVNGCSPLTGSSDDIGAQRTENSDNNSSVPKTRKWYKRATRGADELSQPTHKNDKNTVALKTKKWRGRVLCGDVSKAKGNEFDYGVMDVFRSSKLRLYTLVLAAIWFVAELTYLCLNFNVTFLAGNRYFNAFMYALMEVPAYIVPWVMTFYLGRRVPLVLFQVIGGVALVMTIMQNYDLGFNTAALTLTFTMLGKFCTTASFALLYLITPEIYPTNVRNIGFGMCTSIAEISGFVAPYSRILARTHPWMPQVIAGILTIITGLVALVLPETRHTKLPETIAEAEGWKETRQKTQTEQDKEDVNEELV